MVTSGQVQLPDGQYKIMSALSGKVLSVNGGVAHDGTEIVQWPDENQPNQCWQLTKVAEEGGEVVYTLEQPGTGMVMEAPGPWHRGVPVVMRRYEQDGGDQRHRQWKIEPVKPDLYKIVNRRRPFNTSDEGPFVIDIQDGNPDWAPPSPTNIRLYPSWDFSDYDHPGERQHWKLVSVGTVSGRLVNGGFEEPKLSSVHLLSEDSVPGRRTTASDHIIEMWVSGFNDVPADAGSRQFAELNANYVSTLYQDVATTPGAVLSWRLSHRGRLGQDTMALDIGAPDAVVEQQRMTDDNKQWGHYAGSYTVPEGQTITRFACRSVSAAGGDPTQGNFLDNVFFGPG